MYLMPKPGKSGIHPISLVTSFVLARDHLKKDVEIILKMAIMLNSYVIKAILRFKLSEFILCLLTTDLTVTASRWLTIIRT